MVFGWRKSRQARPLDRRGTAEETAHSVTRRGLFMLGAQLGIGGLLGWRMRELQVVEAERYHVLAEENRINMRLIAPARAQLYDRNGTPLAVNTRNYRVVMVREDAGDVEAVLDRLSQLIDIPDHQRRRIMKEIKQKPAFVPVGVAEHLTWEDFAEINANAPALPGIFPDVGLSRRYPHGDIMTHVIGYVGRVSTYDLKKIKDAGREVDPILQIPEFQIGKSGLERALDTKLRGNAGVERVEVNSVGRVIRPLEDGKESAPGEDLHVTVDLQLQKYCNDRLSQEKSASAVVIDVRNGDLLAMSSVPTFDPNPFVLGISQKAYDELLTDSYKPMFNKSATGRYPPGSTFKMIVALAALEHGIIGPDTTFYCQGHLKLGNRKFHCWNRGGHGWVNLRKSLEQSCDVFYYEVARQVGIERIGEMARRFGLGVRPDIPVTALRAGRIPTKAWKREHKENEPDWLVGDTLNAGIGQGFVEATPVQLAVMIARIAAGSGVKPRLIRARGGTPVPVEAPDDLKIDPKHFAWVRRGMYDVVNSRRGTAHKVKIREDDYRMAGKTGTSQVRSQVVDNDKVPWEKRDHALFVGYAPHNNPRYAVSVVVQHGGGGSKTAAPIARDILLKTREIFERKGDTTPAKQGAAPDGSRPTRT